MAKTAPIGLRVEPELKEQLEKVAEEENRSVANLIETVMRAWLDNRIQKRRKSYGKKAGR